MIDARMTPDQLRQEARGHDKSAQESFDRCDTDGFLSQWASGITAQQLRLEASIRENGGTDQFMGLFTIDGKRVRAKIIHTVFYMAGIGKIRRDRWAFCDANDKFTGVFITAGLKERNLAKKGFKEQEETAHAKAAIEGEGHGLSGSAWVATKRMDKGYPEDAIVV
jgi:hypothetical protein